MVANVIRHMGTEEQKRLIVPKALAGRSSSCSASPSPKPGPMWQPRRLGPCVTVKVGHRGEKMSRQCPGGRLRFRLARTNPDVAKTKG